MYVKKLRGVEEREFLTTHTKKKRPKWKRSFSNIYFSYFSRCKGLCVVFYSTHTTLSLSALCSSLLLVFPSFIQSFSACLNDLVKEFVVGIIIRLEKIKKRDDTNFFYLDFLGLSLLTFCYYYRFSLHCFILCVDIFTSCLYINTYNTPHTRFFCYFSVSISK